MMNCLNIAQHYKLYTLFALLMTFASNRVCQAVPLPSELSIYIGNETIKGYQGSTDEITQFTHDYAKGQVTDQQATDFPKEGFVYQVSEESPNGFKVSAWSNRGNDRKILEAAQDALTQIAKEARIAQNDDPAGYLYSGKLQKRYLAAKKLNAVKPVTIVANTATKAAVPALEMKPQTAQITEVAPVTGFAVPTWIWYLLFILGVLIAVAIGVRWLLLLK